MTQMLERPNSIEQTAETYATLHPGYDLVSYFEAGMPVYKVLIKVSVLQDRNLPMVSEFVLKMVDSGVAQVDDMARWLGIPESYLYTAAADLLRNDILSHDDADSLIISPKGRSTLHTLSLKVPQVVGMSIMVNALTGTLEPWASGLTKGNTIKRLGLAALPPYQPKPSVSTLSFNLLKTLVRQLKRDTSEQAPPGDLLDLVSFDRVYTEYRRMHVLVYQEPNGQNFELSVFDGRHRMPEEEQFLRRMERSGVRVVRSEWEKHPQQVPGAMPIELDYEQAKVAAVKYAELRHEYRTLAQRLESAKEGLANVEFPDENTETRARVLALEDRLRELEGSMVEIDSSYRAVSAFEQRALLERAIAEAREAIVILSPWLRRTGLDEGLLGQLELSLQKKVRVFVGYGNKSNERPEDQHLVDRLVELQNKTYGQGLVLRSLDQVDAKCVLCDRAFFVASTFEWLSFRGDDSRPLLQEKGIYCGVADQVSRIHESALSLFGQSKDEPIF